MGDINTMVDIYLLQQLTGTYQNKFLVAYEKRLEEFASSLSSSSESIASLTDKKASFKMHMNEILAKYNLETQILNAIQFLTYSGAEYLSKEHYQQMLRSFNLINDKLSKVDLEQNLPDDIKEFLEVEETLLEAIYGIVENKFKEADYSTALSCLALLSALDPLNINYWYSEGIVAQKCSLYPLALIAYSRALELDASLIGAWLFSSQCYLEEGQEENAKEALERGKNLNAHEQGWGELILQLEEKLYH